MSKRLLILLIPIALVIIFFIIFVFKEPKLESSSPSISAKPLETKQAVRFMPNWFPEAEFAGYFFAKHFGIYDQLNLDVEILPFIHGYDISESLAAGKIDFAVLSMNEFVRSCNNKKELVVLGAIFQYEPSVFISKAGEGLNSPSDFKGKKIICKNSDWKRTIQRVITASGLSLDDVQLVEGQDKIEMFINGEVDIWAGYAFDEPIELEIAGVNTKTIYLYDYGIGDYQGIIATRAALVENEPRTVEAFLEASIYGWDVAIKDQESALKAIMAFDPEISMSFQRKSMSAIVPFIHTGELPKGMIDRARWDSLMREKGLENESSLDLSFLEKIYSMQRS